MKKTAKGFYILMVVVLSVLLSLGTAAAAASHPFKDVISRYDESVSYFYNEGIIKGKSKTEFGTYDSLKRGDAAVILSGALGLDTKNAPDAGFKDVNSRIKGHVNALVKEGVIKGFSDTEFSPDTHLTRGQMAAILVRAFDLGKYAKKTPFTDLSPTFKGDIEALYGAGITGGITATKYGTNELIKRGDFAVLLYKTMNLEQDEVEVKSVKDANPVHVPVGALLTELNLPQEVEVVYTDNTTGKKKVEWNTTGLDLNKQEEYTIQGTVEGTTIKATIKVTVHKPEVEQPGNLTVAKGMKIENIVLPKQVKLIYKENMTAYRNVTWNTEGLDLNKEGNYLLTGKIERLSSEVTMKVIVTDVRVEKLPDIIVAKGSALADVKLKLPKQVKLIYSDEKSENKNVTWDTADLNLEKAGEYELTGSIADTPWNTKVKVIVTGQVYPDSVELDKSNVTLLKGTDLQLTASVKPDVVANKNLTWSSSNKAVVTVDQTGKVTAVAKGYAAIVVTTENGKTAAVNVTVVDDYIPYLEVDAEAGKIQNDRIKEVKFNIKNEGESSILLEKIEIYDNKKLDKTLDKKEFEKNNINPVIKSNESRSMSFSWSHGFYKNNSFVKLYFSLDGKQFVYTRNL